MIDNKYKKLALIFGCAALLFFLVGVIWFGSSAGKVDNQYVKITSDVKEIQAGWGYQLEVDKNIHAGSTLEYKSSNPEILTISNTGYMNAIKPGEVTVTVQVEGDSKVSDSRTITVTEEKEKLVLSEKTVYLRPNEERKIYVYNTNPEGYLTWETSDEFIATVTDGLIKGINYGDAEIKVTNENDISATVKVKVLSPDEEETIELQDVYIYEQDVGLDVGETLQLTVVFDPRDVTDKSLIWESSNSDAVTVSSDGLITAIGDGNATITAKAYNGLVAKCETTATTNIIPITDIKLSTDNVKLDVGDGYTIKATISPSNATSKNVRWASSNPSVATVRGGVIIALKEGTTTITATTNNGKTATAKITVVKKIVEPYSVSIDKKNMTISVGGKATMYASITPSNAQNKTITWTSSDKSVATVSNGQVTGVKSGTATITATTFNGKSATATVTVTDKAVDVQSITLNQTSVSLSAGATVSLKVTYNPSNATNQSVTWSSSNTSVASVTTSGVVKANKGGTATITARTSNGKTATCTVEVKKANDEIIIRKRNASYSGNPISATISAKSGTLNTPVYYSNASCTIKTNTTNAKTEGGPPVEPGVYYVIASSRGNTSYNPATSPCTEAVEISTKQAKLYCITTYYNSKPQVIARCTGGTVKNATYTNVGTYQVQCDGNTGYSNANPIDCKILQKNISSAQVSGLSSVQYTGNPIYQTPIVKIDLGGTMTTLVNNRDYTYETSNNVNVGRATITITGKGSFTGTKKVQFEITKEPARVTCDNKTYNGSSQLIATCTGGTPNSAAHQTNAGDHSNIGCTPDSSHSAPATITCKIFPYTISSLIVSNIPSKQYTGSPINLSASAFTVKININGTTKTLSHNVDYTFTVSNNTNVGYARVTITGKGNYTGSYVTQFEITKAPSSITCQNKTYNGYSQTIAVCNGGTLQNANQTNAGDYTVTCKGDGNHTDSTSSSPCKIAKANDVPTITFKEATSYGSPVYAIVSAKTCTSTTNPPCTVRYYRGNDTSCTGTPLNGAPTAQGTYYAKARSIGNNNYNAADSACTKAIKIN